MKNYKDYIYYYKDGKLYAFKLKYTQLEEKSNEYYANKYFNYEYNQEQIEALTLYTSRTSNIYKYIKSNNPEYVKFKNDYKKMDELKMWKPLSQNFVFYSAKPNNENFLGEYPISTTIRYQNAKLYKINIKRTHTSCYFVFFNQINNCHLTYL